MPKRPRWHRTPRLRCGSFEASGLRRRRLARACQRLLPLAFCVGCTRESLPDPRLAAQRWDEAVQRKDADAVYALLTESTRQALGRDGVHRVLERDARELSAAARAASAMSARSETLVDVSYANDRHASLVWEEGAFKVAAAGALPARAARPEDALRELREVLARHSFSGLLRVLTRDAGESLEANLKSVLESLEDPASAEIEVDGRRATARLPGGHVVRLEREDGAWHIRDFD
jgi:hypothetical protein